MTHSVHEKFSPSWADDISEAQDYVKLNLDDVKTVNDQWSLISEHMQSGDLENKALIDTAKQVLTGEQEESVRSLIEMARDVPYEDMHAYLTKLENDVEELKSQINLIESQVSQGQAKIIAQKELLESIAPNIQAGIAPIVESEISKLKAHELSELKERLSSVEAVLELATDLYERTGEEWPIPALADVRYEPGENEIFTVDQFPNERESTGQKIKEQVTKNYGNRLNDASMYLAVLLKYKPGHIWTGEELGETIYDDGSDDKRNSSRISALISNYRRGKVPTMAREFGEELVLQRGKRQIFDAKTNKSVPNSIRVVWRLVDIETAINAQIVTTLNSDRTERQTYGEWEPTTMEKIRLGSLPSGDYDGSTLVVSSDETAETAENTSEDVENERIDWRESFSSAVHDTVEDLKRQGIMEQPNITWKALRIQSDSNKAGTETMRERAFGNKIIKRGEMADESIVTISQVILSMLQNSHPNIFKVARRRREAFQIVDDIVEGYYRTRAE